MIRRLLSLVCVAATIAFGATLALANQSEKSYAEALLNLGSIEHYFTRQPIYLSKDEELKSKLKRKLTRVIEIIESYVESNPRDEKTLFVLGKSYSYAHDLDISGSWQKSVEYLNKAIELDPKNENAHIIQGKNYLDAQKSTEALAEYAKADEINPTGKARYFMGIANLHLGKIEEAKVLFKEYLKSHPEDQAARQILDAVESGQIEFQ